MPKVIADITMSLDGFVTGEGADRGLTTLDRAPAERVGARPKPGFELAGSRADHPAAAAGPWNPLLWTDVLTPRVRGRR